MIYNADLRWSVELELSCDELAEILLSLQSRRESNARDAYYRLCSLDERRDGARLYKHLRSIGSEPVCVKMPIHTFEGIRIALAGIKRPSGASKAWREYIDDVNLDSRRAILSRLDRMAVQKTPKLSRRADEIDESGMELISFLDEEGPK